MLEYIASRVFNLKLSMLYISYIDPIVHMVEINLLQTGSAGPYIMYTFILTSWHHMEKTYILTTHGCAEIYRLSR